MHITSIGEGLIHTFFSSFFELSHPTDSSWMEMEKRRTRRREEKRRSTTDNLSDDLMVEILRLLPLNSIVQCRNVCKRWQSLTNYFLTNPFNVAASRHCHPHNYRCMERAERGGEILQISDLDLCIDFPKEGPYDSRILSSCNGLFFCAYFFANW